MRTLILNFKHVYANVMLEMGGVWVEYEEILNYFEGRH